MDNDGHGLQPAGAVAQENFQNPPQTLSSAPAPVNAAPPSSREHHAVPDPPPHAQQPSASLTPTPSTSYIRTAPPPAPIVISPHTQLTRTPSPIASVPENITPHDAQPASPFSPPPPAKRGLPDDPANAGRPYSIRQNSFSPVAAPIDHGVRRPVRAMSTGLTNGSGRPRERDRASVGMSIGMGIGDPQLGADGHMSRRSGLDYLVPFGNGNGLPGAGANGDAPKPPLRTESSIGERLAPTLANAQKELASHRLTAKANGWALNVAIGAQVVLGALTTGVAAATTGRQTSIATSILGGMSTLAASYLAKARGSGEPEASLVKVKELESFVRDLESFILDRGYIVVHGGEHQGMDDVVEGYRRRLEEILGNVGGSVRDRGGEHGMHGEDVDHARGEKGKKESSSMA